MPEVVPSERRPDDGPTLNLGILLESLGDMTQCYKVLFLRSLIEALAEGGGCTLVRYEDLALRMAEAAWWPLRRYHLKTGRDDVLGRAVLKLPAARTSGERLRRLIASNLPQQRGRDGYLRYVPQRLLRPWFAAAKVALADDVDGDIEARSMGLRDALLLPYGLVQDGINVLPAWRSYFVGNAAVLTGWLELLWLDWLQQRNPLVPVTRGKLSPPPGRRELPAQREVFRRAFEAMAEAGRRAPTCVFTGEPVAFPTSPIDHFLPWNFVAHDGIWNLAPVVDKPLNSRKSDRIPDCSFIPGLAALHREVVSSLDPKRKGDLAVLEEYGLGLRLEVSRLRHPGVLEAAYLDVLPPMMATARTMGFKPFSAAENGGDVRVVAFP